MNEFDKICNFQYSNIQITNTRIDYSTHIQIQTQIRIWTIAKKQIGRYDFETKIHVL